MENQTMIIGSGINGYVYAVATQGVSVLAISEAVYSQLPGREDGPADAYRHILLAAELTRQFGETYASALLNGHEFTGSLDYQTAEAKAMDLYNNQLGVEIGKRLAENPNASWNDVVNEARELFDPNNNNGDGARWLDNWSVNPKDGKEEIPNGDPRLNWPPTWSDSPFYNNPFDLGGLFNGMLKDAQGLLGGAAWGIADALSDLFNSAQGWMPPRRFDPLVLDIDGDGIETIQININSPILFDHDGDGVKIATGWVKSDDALLVFDRNANGTIDNGSELFGDQTIVNGVKATDGFAALSAEDSNANGIFDANDTNFNNVRLWQDLNQNGISETNELKTLTQAGIVSISLSSTQTNTVVNGGIQTAKGTFTKVDGTSGESATVDVGSVGNYIFDSNSFYREFTDTIPLTEAASALPEMQGSGVVRDLQQAASMQTTEGAVLTNILTQYSSLTTHDEQIAFMDELLLAWGATSGFKDIATEATQHGYTLTTNLNAEQFSMLNVLEQFNGRHFYRMPWESTPNTTARLGMSVDETTKTISINMFEGQLSILEQAYETLVESVYGGLALQTRLTHYLDSITINIDENGLTFDIAPMITQLEAVQLTSPRDALIDQLELIQYAGKNLSIMGWNWSETLQTMITQIGTQVDVKAVFNELGYINDNNAVSNIVYDLDGTNRIDYHGSENAILVGLDGNDIIYSGYGNDLINGGMSELIGWIALPESILVSFVKPINSSLYKANLQKMA